MRRWYLRRRIAVTQLRRAGSSRVPARGASALPLGQRVYLQHCQVCHGREGRGNGAAPPSMSPRPRDFTQGKFKYKSSAAEAAPTEEDLLRTVRDGLQASAMPAFGDLLSAEELRAVVA